MGLGDEAAPGCSPCSPQEPWERLLSALEARDLPGFRATLLDVSPEDPHCLTCLHRAAADPLLCDFLRLLLEAGVDPNSRDPDRKRTPLLAAADAANADAVQAILLDKRTDVNVLDQFGNTPLLVLVQRKGAPEPDRVTHCVTLLLAHPQVDVNKLNRKGHSAVLWAARKGPAAVVEALLNHPGTDLDSASFVDGKTVRTLLADNFPELLHREPPPPSADTPRQASEDQLMLLLYAGTDHDIDKFCALVSEGRGLDLDHHDGRDTLLQRASVRGFAGAVRALLAGGADPNMTCPLEKTGLTPLILASVGGHAEVVRALLAERSTRVDAVTNEGDTALIKLVRSWDRDQPGYRDCLDELLGRVDINATNEKGDSALYYASMTEDHQLMLDLLKAGAYIGGPNRLHRLPLTHIPPEVLRAHLDDCLKSHQSPFSESYRIQFDYGCLVPPARTTTQGKMGSQKLLGSNHHANGGGRAKDAAIDMDVYTNLKAKDEEGDDLEEGAPHHGLYPETEPLFYMTRKPDLRPLLKHPVLTTFMELKWRKLSLLFSLNIIFYILFVAFITVHILWGNGRNAAGSGRQGSPEVSAPAKPANYPGFLCREWIPLDNCSSGEPEPPPPPLPPPPTAGRLAFNKSVHVVSGILLIILALRELFQFFISPRRYLSWSNKENYLEVVLIVCSAVVLISTVLQPYFSAVTILLSWGELVLLVGWHPLLSTYIEMLKTVSWNFLKFLAWYAILIVAFALSFYTLFRDNADSDFFDDLGLSVFKTAVMMTGEFDASDIPFVEFPVVSHVVFVMFVFLIAIVLFNLLNGLAVSDTQAIKDDAELVGLVSRVKLVAHIERTVLGYNKTSWWHLLAGRVTLFSGSKEELVVGHVLPNQKAALWLGRRQDKAEVPPKRSATLNREVVKAAEALIATKGRPTDIEQIKNRLASVESLLMQLLAKNQ